MDHSQLASAGRRSNRREIARQLKLIEYRTFEDCLYRLEVRGLIASGTGDTNMDALYDLLGCLYVVPVSESLPLRAMAFLKMLFQGGSACDNKASILQDPYVKTGISDSKAVQTSFLSTAELIKYVDLGVIE